MDLNSNATMNQSQLTPGMQELLERKLRKLNNMTIQEVYQMPQVQNNDYRLYKEAVGLIDPEQVKREQDEIRMRSERWEQNQQKSQYQQPIQDKNAYQQQQPVFESQRKTPRDIQPRAKNYIYSQNMGGSQVPMSDDSQMDNLILPNQASSHPTQSMRNYQPPPLPVKASMAQQVKSTKPMGTPIDDGMLFGGSGTATKASLQDFNLNQIQFQKLILRVKFETSFGQDLWLLGSPDFLSSWDPTENGGRGGMQMKWTTGHLWVAEIPYSKVKQIGPDQKFEFKFMVKFNNTTEKTYKIIQWEGGSQNHAFNGQHIQQSLQEENTKKHIKRELSNQFTDSPIKIGTYQGTRRLNLPGTQEGDLIPDKVDKCVIYFDPKMQALIFHQYWQN